ncbi:MULTISPECIES: amidophosphoribosyltransferase [Thermoactinomyces]|jgi:amidophosphoribosyltransferase|uniref:Amidophosphoribosyltransferase n=1 Tax=Thermoactinomyces daqus TaxID=1329516 RepID=A0A7W1XB27_9BACL|nr:MULTISPECIES: amidophosphoribosyltransferase [Thermoactinomyces]MBA4543351.1 amidophosphoribosyltransferase [Thermoactinomyces daqus]MBH8599495.1 amidophosphoribosyltransferase [Thermoactinomyces sp. CICC 10523]MBH8605283.1 amidophosphoribosyltransferase [Thermoactinomyces sp. CICC 10522]MBH8608134.1 amidophosphoribosyltransferase [Thermoactinomyces sp. CICC 10521]
MRDESIFDLDELNEECGVFGIIGHPEAARLTYYGLHALQHRGQESAGIVSTNHDRFFVHRGTGLVTEVFDQEIIRSFQGETAIGHVRYSTTGGTGLRNAQPLVFNYVKGELALATNGNLVNAGRLRQELEAEGSIFQTTTDTEVIAHLIARSRAGSLEEAVKEALNKVTGAYALLILTNDKLIAAQDPHGLRPLSLGKIGDALVFASETCAFDVIGAEFVREVEPGEMLVFDREGVRSLSFAPERERAGCVFEYVYFARPDSIIGGVNVHAARKRMGSRLAKEAPVEADVVTGVPDSSTSAAIGYAEAAGIPYEIGLIKSRYAGRTFIQPNQELREQGVKMKLSAVRGVLEGKRVVMVDDSIVRGTTSRRIVQMLRDAGATEVHVRISSPPVKHPCFYGIDTPDRDQLIAAYKSVEEIRKEIGADTLAFLSTDGLIDAVESNGGGQKRGHCLACFTGRYPTEIEELVLEGKR